MIDIEEYKKAIGKKAQELTEQQILKLRDDQDKMAEVFMMMWRKSLQKKELGAKL